MNAQGEDRATFRAFGTATAAPVDFRPLASSAQTEFRNLFAAFAGQTNISAPDHEAPASEEIGAKNDEPGETIESLRTALAQREAYITDMVRCHDITVERLRNDMEHTMAAAIAHGLREAIETLKQGISEQVDAILRPFVAVSVRERILDGLRTAILDITGNCTVSRIRVSGPRGLIDSLRVLMVADQAAIEFIESEELELVGDLDSRLVTTRFADWSRLLASETAR